MLGNAPQLDAATFAQLILNQAQTITHLITQGAQWELSLHTAVFDWLTHNGYNVLRESPYAQKFFLPEEEHRPKADTRESLDVLMHDAARRFYAIEFKVESAKNAGQAAGKAIKKGLEEDIAKLPGYVWTKELQDHGGPLVARWVVGVYYSGGAARTVAELAHAHPNAQIFSQGGVSVIIIPV